MDTCGFLIGGLDDLFFDTHFLFYLWRARKRRNVSLQELRLAPEQWVALCVPAWQEGTTRLFMRSVTGWRPKITV